MREWPDDLSFFVIRDGERSQTGNNLIRYQTDVGPPIVRRRTTMTIPQFRGTTRWMTPDDAARLRAFYDADLAGGALAFRAVDPYTGGLANFRFVGGYTEKSNGRLRRFTADLEILP